MVIRESVLVGGRELSLETGRVAKQADGSVVVRFGDTVVLVTAVSDKTPRDVDFLPLTVEYTERMYAAGRIPGSYFRREGRPSSSEVLSCRLIDRPIRPLFPDGYRNETQVIAMVLSSDRENPADVLALTATSTALHLSDIPWAGPVAAVRVGRVNGEFVANPTQTQQLASDLNIVAVASFDALVMVEGHCRFCSEHDLVAALQFAQEQARPLLDLQERLRGAVGREKRPFTPVALDEALIGRVTELSRERLVVALAVREKRARSAALKQVASWLAEQLPTTEKLALSAAFSETKRRHVRQMVVRDSIRIDGRRLDEIREINCEVGVLPRTHGSALFTRGETQALATATLATQRSDQRIESVMGDYTKSFLLHYNFPPFSTGEAKRFGPAGRREIGHGNLAECSLAQVLPDPEQFPYVLRVVSETLESNGSSSMASVCGGSLALMDAGVPIRAPVAGIAMGLIAEEGRYAVLSDILGDEDHLGDMDFKVTGTREGICAIQMDIKLESVPAQVLEQALEQARTGRLHILDRMAQAIDAPRATLSAYAPRILTLKIKPDRIRDVIGPGGKTIRAIQDQTSCEINVSDDGTVTIAAFDAEGGKRALALVEGLTAEAEIGAYYRGRVRRVADFGAFVEIMPGMDGLIHISELDRARVERVEDICREGDEVVVKVINIDREGKIRLSRKEALGVDPSSVRSMV
ncbi:MAG: polyribonucleotide nucleotidyltransferase [Proteobacteria bacterium]|nr:polyribonucleotide nucleotidyltransferase [Pseudomonadota bacterium]